MNEFWEKLDQFVTECPVRIDRPKGSAHPRYPECIYPLDYGYLEKTTSSDGAEIDVWVGSEDARRLDAIVCSADATKRDVEIKLLLGCTPEEAEIVRRFHNEESQSAILIRRERK